jgi:hypothetical protein
MYKPELADEMIVFITIWLAMNSFFVSFVICMLAPAFINNEEISTIKVPAMRKDMFEA